MNILFYQIGLNPTGGGVQRVTFNVSRELTKRNIHCFVAYWNTEKLFNSLDCYDGHVHLPLINNDSRDTLKKYIVDNDISVIINQCAENVGITKSLFLIKKQLGIKLYSFLHLSPTASRDGSNYYDFRFPLLVLRGVMKKIILNVTHYDRRRLLYSYTVSDKMVLLSEKFRDDFIHVIGREKISDNKLCYISNACSFNDFFDIKQVDKKNKMILIVSRMVEMNKRITIPIDVWRNISNRYPDWKMLIIGDGPDLKSYKRLVKKYSLDNIYLLGSANPLPYYEESSIFLMTSLHEGFGMTLLESQQMGVVPVVIDSYKSLHDIVVDGYNGLITKDGCLADYQEKLEKIMNNIDMRYELARNAINSSKRFLPSVIAEKWIDLLCR